MVIIGQWTKLTDSEPLKRSSVCASVVGSTVYAFGGELKPRQPRDNNIYSIEINPSNKATIRTVDGTSDSPSPRVGAATTSLKGKLYLFSGRGGEAMTPIEEKGYVWMYDPSTEKWTSLPPSSNTYPEARSYHCMTNNAVDTIYVHAGCPEKGRLSDLWAFNLNDFQWVQLAPAPAPPRGGPSIAFVDGKLYRINGFDGKTEQGGSLDIYDIATDSWTSHTFLADGKTGPGARSVSALVPIRTKDGVYLVTPFGENDPSSLGHLGAGKMLSDVWAFSLQDRIWSKVEAASGDIPASRGWFGADVASVDGKDRVVVVGGLDENNDRLGDVWLLTLV